MTQNNFFYNLNKRLAGVTGETHSREKTTEIANEAALSTVESVFAKMNSQPAGQVVREADSDKLAALRDRLPFEPDTKPVDHKDEFGNEIKHMARHLARMGMHDAERSLEKSGDVEEGVIGQTLGTLAGGALGGPVGAAIGGAVGNNLTDDEQLDELSPLRTSLYKGRAEKDAERHKKASEFNARAGNDWASKAHSDQYDKRIKGIAAADRRLGNEQLDEMSMERLATNLQPEFKQFSHDDIVNALHTAKREIDYVDDDAETRMVLSALLRSPTVHEEKKADRDYDGDGKIETGSEEFLGSRDRAIKASLKKPQSIKESMDDTDFINYVFSFYGPRGIYDMGATRKQIAQALDMYRDEPDTDFAADSVDREKIRDIMIDRMGLKFPEGGIKVNEGSNLDQSVIQAVADIKDYYGEEMNREEFLEALWDYLDEQFGNKYANRALEAEDELWSEYAGQLDELSPDTLKSYRERGDADVKRLMREPGTDANNKKLANRLKGWGQASARLGESDLSDSLSDAARELTLFADNDQQLYRSSYQPIVANLEKKAKKGIYEPELARKLWKYHADRAAQRYAQEYGDGTPWQKMFTPDDRREAAAYFEEAFREELMANGLLDEQFIMESDYWDFKDLKDEPTSRTRSIAGRAYGGAAQVDDEEDSDDTPDVKRGRGRPAGTAKKTGARGPKIKEGTDSSVDMGEWMDKFRENEDINYHTENAVMIADLVGNDRAKKVAREIQQRHDREGSLSQSDSKLRSKIYALWPKVEAKFEEWKNSSGDVEESFDAKINPAKRGMFDGKTREELVKQYNNLKASGPHKQGSAENTKMHELAFAIRAKGQGSNKWGKVNK